MQAQLAVRHDRKSADAIKAAHSHFNCMPRFSYKHNKSQRNLYPTEAEQELYKNVLVKGQSGEKTQFQLLYPVQIYPNFLEHLADCLTNPIDIIKKNHALV